MKFSKTVMFLALLFFANTASAVFISTEIKSIQVSPGSNSITVYLRENIRNDRCADRSAETIFALSFKKNDVLFNEMFAGLKYARENDEPILVLSSSGQCQYPYTVLTQPLVRFGSLY